jgi:hypothetical protein
MADEARQRPNPDVPRGVTAVVITYNSAHAIGPCLAALPPIPCIVVDNASDDDTLDVVRKTRPDALVLRNDRNLGYGRAVNRGFDNVATPYALLLNPDAICATDAVAALRRAYDLFPDAGIIVPLLEDSAGRFSLPVMGPRERHHHPATAAPEGPFCTWFVTAAAWLCAIDVWRRIGGFDQVIFMYGEDTDLCLRMSAARRAMIVAPEARVTHLGGRSSWMDWRVRWRKDWHMTWGHFYVMAKHGESAQARDEALRYVIRHGLKALLYVLLLNPKRVLGNFARAHAAFTHLGGGRP